MPHPTEEICILCQSRRVLCNSHIIPEICHSTIYDEKHRALSFSPADPERTSFMQKGIRSRLLCPDCECKINDWYEKPFYQFWINNNALAPLSSTNRVILKDVPYESFKLFHLSVLLRAAMSDHCNFCEIDLGAQIDEVRQMVHDRQAGLDSNYQIICSAIEGENGDPWHELIGPAHRITIDSASGFYFTFCGAQWLYITQGSTPMINKICLKENGTLPIVKMPCKAITLYRALPDSME